MIPHNPNHLHPLIPPLITTRTATNPSIPKSLPPSHSAINCPRLDSLRFDINKEDSLNNRFKEITDLETDVVFSIDDDVIFPCSSVEFAFDVWQSAPDAMVGFVPRVHWVDSLTTSLDMVDGGLCGGRVHIAWCSPRQHSFTKSISVSTQMRCHHRFENMNCEDIAMSFLVANAIGAPPLWVKGKIYEIGLTGINSLGGHSIRRSECVNIFTAEFGRMPLDTSLPLGKNILLESAVYY
ncbi:glycosylinositol phosphorylceramide mannosyl transferase 1-like [Vicia villosa]|uniref:glycosylinositol phosphorylceramide mannosyl transferase 1-like n=1 Tax=Vicia villosa TaxID=3911 RepID=UPI00273A7FD2|nr:glycosylinositol phosphorylceramide mannosyl transferase 1-like [Vicia villosa]